MRVHLHNVYVYSTHVNAFVPSHDETNRRQYDRPQTKIKWPVLGKSKFRGQYRFTTSSMTWIRRFRITRKNENQHTSKSMHWKRMSTSVHASTVELPRLTTLERARIKRIHHNLSRLLLWRRPEIAMSTGSAVIIIVCGLSACARSTGRRAMVAGDEAVCVTTHTL